VALLHVNYVNTSDCNDAHVVGSETPIRFNHVPLSWTSNESANVIVTQTERTIVAKLQFGANEDLLFSLSRVLSYVDIGRLCIVLCYAGIFATSSIILR
jgi:hypothetical protein